MSIQLQEPLATVPPTFSSVSSFTSDTTLTVRLVDKEAIPPPFPYARLKPVKKSQPFIPALLSTATVPSIRLVDKNAIPPPVPYARLVPLKKYRAFRTSDRQTTGVVKVAKPRPCTHRVPRPRARVPKRSMSYLSLDAEAAEICGERHTPATTGLTTVTVIPVPPATRTERTTVPFPPIDTLPDIPDEFEDLPSSESKTTAPVLSTLATVHDDCALPSTDASSSDIPSVIPSKRTTARRKSFSVPEPDVKRRKTIKELVSAYRSSARTKPSDLARRVLFRIPEDKEAAAPRVTFGGPGKRPVDPRLFELAQFVSRARRPVVRRNAAEDGIIESVESENIP